MEHFITILDTIQVLLISGSDAFKYLQSQFSQDLSPLNNTDFKNTIYGFFLEKNGTIRCDAWIKKIDPNQFLLINLNIRSENFLKIVSKNIIADEVTATTMDVHGLYLHGIDELAVNRSNLVVEIPVFTSLNDCIIITQNKLTIPENIDIEPISKFHEKRLSNNKPLFGIEILPGDFPQEVGLERAVSLSKGCFLGQEIMSRLAKGGQVRKQLVRINVNPKMLENQAIIDPETGKQTGSLRGFIHNQQSFVMIQKSNLHQYSTQF